MFYKESCYSEFCNIHMETPVLGSLFNKVAGLQVCNFIKRDPKAGVFLSLLYCESFKVTNFEEHLRKGASVYSNDLLKYKNCVIKKTCFQRGFEFLKKQKLLIHKKYFIRIRKLRSIISFILELASCCCVEITHKIRTSLKTLASKKLKKVPE